MREKVNCLFNDCNEALPKIKQAFRSIAVDLPPEESTAPYHCITLLETWCWQIMKSFKGWFQTWLQSLMEYLLRS